MNLVIWASLLINYWLYKIFFLSPLIGVLIILQTIIFSVIIIEVVLVVIQITTTRIETPGYLNEADFQLQQQRMNEYPPSLLQAAADPAVKNNYYAKRPFEENFQFANIRTGNLKFWIRSLKSMTL